MVWHFRLAHSPLRLDIFLSNRILKQETQQLCQQVLPVTSHLITDKNNSFVVHSDLPIIDEKQLSEEELYQLGMGHIPGQYPDFHL